MTTTTAAYTLYQKMTKAGMDENVAKTFVEYEAERSEDLLTSKDGQIIIEKMSAMEANIKAEIASNRTSTYQAVAIGTGLIMAAIGIATSLIMGGSTP